MKFRSLLLKGLHMIDPYYNWCCCSMAIPALILKPYETSRAYKFFRVEFFSSCRSVNWLLGSRPCAHQMYAVLLETVNNSCMIRLIAHFLILSIVFWSCLHTFTLSTKPLRLFLSQWNMIDRRNIPVKPRFRAYAAMQLRIMLPKNIDTCFVTIFSLY